jgi:hypothetical protein
MVQPFRQSGLAVHYYPVDSLLVPVERSRTCTVGQGSVVLYANYFGFPVSAAAQRLARQQHDHGAVTILDLTHSLFNTVLDEIPSSNYVVASLRKWVGLPDGGLVWKRGSRLSIPLDTDSTDGGFGRTRLVAGLMKGLYCDGILSQKTDFLALFEVAREIADGCTAVVTMSAGSRAIWGQLDAAAIVSARRANYAVLASGISELSSLRLLRGGLPQGFCPIGCPVVSPYRDDLRMFLTSHGVYCPIHWQLPADITIECPESESLSQTMLTLPCDQRYTSIDMDKVVTLLREWDRDHINSRDCGMP